MTTRLALIRGINVGGRKTVAMAELRELAATLGLLDARSLQLAGNLVFRSGARNDAALERLLESAIAKRFHLDADVFVRTAADWKDVVARNPFHDEAARDPGRLLVMFLKSVPQAGDVKALRAAIAGPEIVQARGRHAYIVYPDGIGRSRLTHAIIESKLKTRGTGRNWNTVLSLGALAGLMEMSS